MGGGGAVRRTGNLEEGGKGRERRGNRRKEIGEEETEEGGGVEIVRVIDIKEQVRLSLRCGFPISTKTPLFEDELEN